MHGKIYFTKYILCIVNSVNIVDMVNMSTSLYFQHCQHFGVFTTFVRNWRFFVIQRGARVYFLPQEISIKKAFWQRISTVRWEKLRSPRSLLFIEKKYVLSSGGYIPKYPHRPNCSNCLWAGELNSLSPCRKTMIEYVSCLRFG